MTTLIFIHGTGIRRLQYEETFQKIQQKLAAKRPDIRAVPCCWGESCGTKLNAQGASIPLFDATLALEQGEEEDQGILLWEQLYRDPLYELRVLSLKPNEESAANPFGEQPGEALDSRTRHLQPYGELQAKLAEAGIAELFDQARQMVIRSEPYQQALAKAGNILSDYQEAIARAIIAQTMKLCEEREQFPPILTRVEFRDEVAALLNRSLGEAELALGGWLKQSLSLLLAHSSTYWVKRKRGAITDAFSPMPCDIMLYQSRGAPIRAFIKATIEQAEPPVVLLAHSLGGIACVDLLIQELLPQVKLLVTAGSQAPFLYEINALSSLEYGKPLPGHFPEWLNIFDLRDFLGYIGANVFPNKIQDVLVDNKQPFPQAHSAYWENEATWKAILPRLP